MKEGKKKKKSFYIKVVVYREKGSGNEKDTVEGRGRKKGRKEVASYKKEGRSEGDI